jgi:hypothetical protein
MLIQKWMAVATPARRVPAKRLGRRRATASKPESGGSSVPMAEIGRDLGQNEEVGSAVLTKNSMEDGDQR